MEKCQFSFSPAGGYIGVANTTVSMFKAKGLAMEYGGQLVHHTSRSMSPQLCKKECQVRLNCKSQK